MSIGEFFDGRKRYPIRVRYKKELRDRIDELKKVLVPSPLGQHIPLRQLASVNVVMGPARIMSENGMLRSMVLLNVRNRDLVSFVKDAKKHIQKMDIPKGYSIVWAGQYEDQVRASGRLMILIPIVLLINLLLLRLGLGGFRDASIVFSAIPFAFSGGLILLLLWGFNTSVCGLGWVYSFVWYCCR